jgi:hypothetical protein
MEPADAKGQLIIQSQKVFYIEVWDSRQTATSLSKMLKTEELLELAKNWIDKYESKPGRMPPPPFGDMIDMPF